MKLFVLAVFFIGLTALNATETDTSSTLAEISKHPFGETIVNFVSLNLKQQTPIEDITDLLAEILKDLNQDLSQAEDVYEDKRDRLADAIPAGESTVAALTQQINDLQAAIAKNNQDIANANAQIEKDQAEQAEKQTRLDLIEGKYAGDIQAFDDELAAIDAAIKATNQALALVNQLVANAGSNSVALLQITSSASKKLQSITDQLRESPLTAKHVELTPLITELAELASKADAGSAARIAQLITNLLAILQKARDDYLVAKQNYITAFNSEREILTQRIGALTSSIATNTQNVVDWNNQLAENVKALAAAQQLLALAQAKLDADREENAANEAYWAQFLPKQQNLIALLQKLIDHFNSNVKTLEVIDEINHN